MLDIYLKGLLVFGMLSFTFTMLFYDYCHSHLVGTADRRRMLKLNKIRYAGYRISDLSRRWLSTIRDFLVKEVFTKTK